MTFFANIPVSDVARSRAFYTALGWPVEERFSNEHAVCVAIADGVRLMASSREFFAGLGDGSKQVGDPAATSMVAFAFDLPSREAVDELIERAAAVGAAVKGTDDHGFMYQRDFEDLDGNQFAPFWMDPSGPPQ